MMNQQTQWNIQAERNRNNINIPILSKPGKITTVTNSAFRYNCYLSSNYESISIIFDKSTYFFLPEYAYKKYEEHGDATQNILSKFVIVLPDNNIIQFDKRYYPNLNRNLVVLISDETYDYTSTLTNTFFTPLSPSPISTTTGTIFPIDVKPVQIYFCFDADLFLDKWNSISTSYTENNLQHKKLEVSFPGKINYIDNYVFNVKQSIVISPKISRIDRDNHHLITDEDMKKFTITALEDDGLPKPLNPNAIKVIYPPGQRPLSKHPRRPVTSNSVHNRYVDTSSDIDIETEQQEHEQPPQINLQQPPQINLQQQPQVNIKRHKK